MENKENIEIKKEENLKKENFFSKISNLTRKDKIKICIYIFVLVISLLLKNNSNHIEVSLGDFGSIVPLLFSIISLLEN